MDKVGWATITAGICCNAEGGRIGPGDQLRGLGGEEFSLRGLRRRVDRATRSPE